MRPLSESMVDPVRHIIQTGWLGHGNSGILLPMPLIFKIWKFLAPSWRAQRRWKFLRDYVRRLFITQHWVYLTTRSPDLQFTRPPRSFMQWSQSNRLDRLDNFFQTMTRQLFGDGWDPEWEDPYPEPEVPSLVRFSNFGRRRLSWYEGGSSVTPRGW